MREDLVTAHAFNLCWINSLASLSTFIGVGQRLFIRKCHHQRRCRQFTLSIDANIENVLGIKFKIQPRPTIGNDPGGKQKFSRGMRLATIMIKKYAG